MSRYAHPKAPPALKGPSVDHSGLKNLTPSQIAAKNRRKANRTTAAVLGGGKANISNRKGKLRPPKATKASQLRMQPEQQKPDKSQQRKPKTKVLDSLLQQVKQNPSRPIEYEPEQSHIQPTSSNPPSSNVPPLDLSALTEDQLDALIAYHKSKQTSPSYQPGPQTSQHHYESPEILQQQEFNQYQHQDMPYHQQNHYEQEPLRNSFQENQYHHYPSGFQQQQNNFQPSSHITTLSQNPTPSQEDYFWSSRARHENRQSTTTLPSIAQSSQQNQVFSQHQRQSFQRTNTMNADHQQSVHRQPSQQQQRSMNSTIPGSGLGALMGFGERDERELKRQRQQAMRDELARQIEDKKMRESRIQRKPSVTNLEPLNHPTQPTLQQPPVLNPRAPLTAVGQQFNGNEFLDHTMSQQYTNSSTNYYPHQPNQTQQQPGYYDNHQQHQHQQSAQQYPSHDPSQQHSYQQYSHHQQQHQQQQQLPVQPQTIAPELNSKQDIRDVNNSGFLSVGPEGEAERKRKAFLQQQDELKRQIEEKKRLKQQQEEEARRQEELDNLRIAQEQQELERKHREELEAQKQRELKKAQQEEALRQAAQKAQQESEAIRRQRFQQKMEQAQSTNLDVTAAPDPQSIAAIVETVDEVKSRKPRQKSSRIPIHSRRGSALPQVDDAVGDGHGDFVPMKDNHRNVPRMTSPPIPTLQTQKPDRVIHHQQRVPSPPIPTLRKREVQSPSTVKKQHERKPGTQSPPVPALKQNQHHQGQDTPSSPPIPTLRHASSIATGKAEPSPPKSNAPHRKQAHARRKPVERSSNHHSHTTEPTNMRRRETFVKSKIQPAHVQQAQHQEAVNVTQPPQKDVMATLKRMKLELARRREELDDEIHNDQLLLEETGQIFAVNELARTQVLTQSNRRH